MTLHGQYVQHLEKNNRSLAVNHMENHEINGIYRAKMIDWIVEVLSAFNCSEQTSFLAINIMDRYFDALNNADRTQGRCIKLHELHIIGVTSLFIASKSEDVYPLLMRTIYGKVGHQKISVESIVEKEMEILRALDFKVSTVSTPLHFLEFYIDQIIEKHPERQFIHLMSIYLAKLSLHHQSLCTLQPSLQGASSIYVAFKICEQMRQTPVLTADIVASLLKISSLNEALLVETSRKLLYLAQNFEQELPGLDSLKNIYIPLLNFYVQ